MVRIAGVACSGWKPTSAPAQRLIEVGGGRVHGNSDRGIEPHAMPKMPERKAVPIISRLRPAAMSPVMAPRLSLAYPVFKYMISAISILIGYSHGTAPPSLLRRRRA